MSLELALLLVCLALGIGFFAAYILTKKDCEAKYEAMELELKNKIAKAVSENKKLEAEYREFASNIKALGNTNANAEQFDKLWQKVRNKLPLS